ncbi:MAG: DUF2335 domain-containing protein [Rickettsiales bacterium]|nr:DUF2335 domain-containing protein [Pseudomonadota bacterium]MDA0966601.1 DUF2335 domain-containing protein [Pseudomonadota bacterium]MDG4543630.1 DUF2335 domain-containing protein [Rickettsiales bacterium]MDG4545777.1 DUF2335 domain-containing protein [Rickettsiales bacterium]MDG4547450.1 DUF2335 domain-containing protein [Rickettsiales bacterium]
MNSIKKTTESTKKIGKREHQHRVEGAIAAFTSPLPPPETLKHYEDILPGTTERILSLTEAQSEHRQKHENEYLKAHERIRKMEISTKSSEIKRGQIFGFVALLMWIACIVFFALSGKDTLSYIMAGAAAVTGIIGAFTGNQKKKSSE